MYMAESNNTSEAWIAAEKVVELAESKVLSKYPIQLLLSAILFSAFVLSNTSAPVWMIAIYSGISPAIFAMLWLYIHVASTIGSAMSNLIVYWIAGDEQKTDMARNACHVSSLIISTLIMLAAIWLLIALSPVDEQSAMWKDAP